jgi:hypothetical protein
MDDVEHLTRTPRIFRYLVENYAIAAPRHNDYFLLRPQAGRKEQWHEHALLRPAMSYTPSKSQPLQIDFPPNVVAACSASDLLILRLSLDDQAWLRLPKPGNLYVTLTLSNGEKSKQKIFVPPDGKVHDVIVSASNPREIPSFMSLFHPTRLWRASTRIVGMQVEWVPMDMLSQRPERITLHSISTLQRGGVEVRETGLAQAHDPELLKWCYGDADLLSPNP